MPVKKPQPKAGDVVRIRFMDHVEDGDEVEEFFVYGRVAKVSKQAYTVDSWAWVDPDGDRDGNIKAFTILRAVIKEVVIYESNKPGHT